MASTALRSAILVAIYSRIAVISLQCGFNYFLEDHHSLDAFRVKKSEESSFTNDIADLLLGGLNHWDGQYYLHIAKYGYDTEKILVFLPVYPLLLRILYPLVQHLGDFNEDSSILIASATLNFTCFILSAILICLLTRKYFPSSPDSFINTVAFSFAINPASIFFSANYTESLYTLLTFAGLLFLGTAPVTAGILFGISTLTRSNGIINSFFILFNLVTYFRKNKIRKCFDHAVAYIFSTLPFFAYQLWYIPTFFCNRCPKVCMPFCSAKTDTNSIVFLPYSYLQAKYWNQGFLNFYQMKQIPNFLLATPVLFLTLWSCFRYFRPAILSNRPSDKKSRKSQKLGKKESHSNVAFRSVRHFFVNQKLVPYAIHITFLALYGLFFIHVQVLTRLLSSSSPWIYWAVASLQGVGSKLSMTFFILYFVLGIVLFSNAYPWV